MQNTVAKKKMGKTQAKLVRMILTPEIGMLIPIVILCIVTGLIKDTFFTWKYFSTILRDSVYIGAAALGQAVIQLSGGIDLSVGYTGCLAGIMVGVACDFWGWGLIPCLLVGLLTGALIGAINGFMVTKLKLHSWITTLSTQFICNGLAVTISEGVPIPIEALGTKAFVRMRPLRLTWLFFIFVAMIIILDIVVRRSKYGYKLRAVGGNPNAAIMAGLNVDRIKMTAYILGSLLAACGGLFDVLSKQTASSTYGGGREFRTIICCAVGGISAGYGSILGATVGIALYHVVWKALDLLGFDKNLQLVLIGALLVLSVLMDIQRKRFEARQVAM